MGCCSDVMEPIAAASCCGPKDTAAHAAAAMRSSGCGCAPVVDHATSRKLVGVVTERDVCCNVVADDRRASEISVGTIMRAASACCSTNDSLDEARRKLHEHRATTLPVVDAAGSCCGTVSAHHLARGQ